MTRRNTGLQSPTVLLSDLKEAGVVKCLKIEGKLVKLSKSCEVLGALLAFFLVETVAWNGREMLTYRLTAV